MRVADVLAEVSGHLGDDFFAFGIPLLADLAERFLDGPERFAIVALQDFSQVVGVEHAFGQLVREHGVEKFPRPRLALHEQIDRQRLQFGREFRVLREDDIGELRVFDAAQRGEDAAREIGRGGRRRPPATSRSSSRSRNAISASSAWSRVASGSVGGDELSAHFGRIDGGETEPRREQLCAQGKSGVRCRRAASPAPAGVAASSSAS